MAGKEKAKAKTIAKKEPDKPKEVKQVAYIGPSIQSPIQLIRYATYMGALPKGIQDFLKKNEKFKTLFVDVKSLSKAMAEISNPASLKSKQIKIAMKSLEGVN